MSHFVECQTEFRDPQALVAALIECGFAAEQIEVHQEAVPLFGYQGDVQPQQEHIVIRRQHVGSGTNDVGWERQPDSTYLQLLQWNRVIAAPIMDGNGFVWTRPPRVAVSLLCVWLWQRATARPAGYEAL